jgi:hypothetical protein
LAEESSNQSFCDWIEKMGSIEVEFHCYRLIKVNAGKASRPADERMDGCFQSHESFPTKWLDEFHPGRDGVIPGLGTGSVGHQMDIFSSKRQNHFLPGKTFEPGSFVRREPHLEARLAQVVLVFFLKNKLIVSDQKHSMK